MKKFYSLLLIGFLLSSISCSKDDDNSDNKENTSLAGEWQMEEFQYNGTTTVKQGDMMDESSYIGTAKDIDVTMTFNESEKTWESSGNYVLELVTKVNGETQTSTEPYSNISGSGTFTVDGPTLKLGYDNQAGGFEIDEATISILTENELLLEFEYSETSMVSGYEVSLVVEGSQRFSR